MNLSTVTQPPTLSRMSTGSSSLQATFLTSVILCVQFIQSSGSCIEVIRALEPSLSLRSKDELSTVIVNVLQSVDAATDFLVELIMDEVNNEGNLTSSSYYVYLLIRLV